MNVYLPENCTNCLNPNLAVSSTEYSSTLFICSPVNSPTSIVLSNGDVVKRSAYVISKKISSVNHKTDYLLPSYIDLRLLTNYE